LIISMKNGERLSLEQIQAFLKASEEFRFEASKRKEIYEFVTRTLVEQEYSRQPREAKGVLRHYLGKMTGLPVVLSNRHPAPVGVDIQEPQLRQRRQPAVVLHNPAPQEADRLQPGTA
jgi:hypothetical protein